ncbi:MAG: hypothetical protein WAR57_07310, partial [Candidatus Phosphoribacter sp.]
MPSPQRRLVLTLDGVPTIGRPLVGAGRIWLVELSDDLPSTAPEEHAATPTPTPTPTPTATAWV